MQQGKHTEYEKQLHDEMLNGLSNSGSSPPTQPQQETEGTQQSGIVNYSIDLLWCGNSNRNFILKVNFKRKAIMIFQAYLVIEK